jgi:hypothetical protein
MAISILAIIFVFFNVVAFALPFTHTSVFWIAYSFTVFALLSQIAIFIVAFYKAVNLKSIFMGFPIFRIGYIYLTVQLILGLSLMATASIFPIPAWGAVVPCTVVLALAAICVIATDTARDEIERVDVSVRTDTAFIRGLAADIKSLLPVSGDDETRAGLEKLYEQVRYSDPVSNDGLSGLEAGIGAKFAELKQTISERNGGALESIANISALVNERNLKCRLLKQQN